MENKQSKKEKDISQLEGDMKHMEIQANADCANILTNFLPWVKHR